MIRGSTVIQSNRRLAHTAKVLCELRTNLSTGNKSGQNSLGHAWAKFTLGNFFCAAWARPFLRFSPELRLRLLHPKQMRSTIS
ncbi:hypothetical protein VTH06DRAFT_7895 [Thermothelomyces fergusii]